MIFYFDLFLKCVMEQADSIGLVFLGSVGKDVRPTVGRAHVRWMAQKWSLPQELCRRGNYLNTFLSTSVFECNAFTTLRREQTIQVWQVLILSVVNFIFSTQHVDNESHKKASICDISNFFVFSSFSFCHKKSFFIFGFFFLSTHFWVCFSKKDWQNYCLKFVLVFFFISCKIFCQNFDKWSSLNFFFDKLKPLQRF